MRMRANSRIRNGTSLCVLIERPNVLPAATTSLVPMPRPYPPAIRRSMATRRPWYDWCPRRESNLRPAEWDSIRIRPTRTTVRRKAGSCRVSGPGGRGPVAGWGRFSPLLEDFLVCARRTSQAAGN